MSTHDLWFIGRLVGAIQWVEITTLGDRRPKYHGLDTLEMLDFVYLHLRRGRPYDKLREVQRCLRKAEWEMGSQIVGMVETISEGRVVALFGGESGRTIGD